MFGYVKFNSCSASKEMNHVYRNYYCGCCFALRHNYGILSRLLLNYDVTALSIFLKAHENPHMKKLFCIGQRKQKEFLFQNDMWKKIAGINILVFSEKLKDNIKDDNSLIAKIMQRIFSRQIRRAQQELPEAYSLICEGYNKIAIDEEKNADAISISNDFADMIIDACSVSFSLSGQDLTVLRGIFRWVYIIDALDDYDKDVKKKSFNPLLISDMNFRDFVDSNYKNIHVLIHSIMSDISVDGKTNTTRFDTEDKIISAIVKSTIPSTTARILNGQKNKAATVW